MLFRSDTRWAVAKARAPEDTYRPIQLWDLGALRSQTLQFSAPGERQRITRIEFSSQGDMLTAVTYRGSILRWNVPSGELIHCVAIDNLRRPTTPTDEPTEVKIESAVASQDGRWVFWASQGVAHIAETETGSNVWSASWKGYWTCTNAFSPDGRFFATSSDGYTMRLWRTTEDRKSTRLNSSHSGESRMPSSA